MNPFHVHNYHMKFPENTNYLGADLQRSLDFSFVCDCGDEAPDIRTATKRMQFSRLKFIAFIIATFTALLLILFMLPYRQGAHFSFFSCTGGNPATCGGMPRIGYRDAAHAA
jgi:hypothetical protein